jgi:MATE family multidrug resistance protein
MLFGGVIAIFPFFITSMFTQDSVLAQVSTGILVFTPIYLLSDSIQLSCAQILRGFEDTTVPMLIQVFAYWGIGFPLAYSLGVTDFWGQPYGVYGFWAGFYVGITLAAVLLSWRVGSKLVAVEFNE